MLLMRARRVDGLLVVVGWGSWVGSITDTSGAQSCLGCQGDRPNKSAEERDQ